MTSAYSLQWLIEPISRQRFLRDHWESTSLLVQRNRPDYFDGLLSIDDVDRVLTTLNLRHPDVNMVNADETVTRDQYTVGDGVIDVARVCELFAAGSTIILQQLHRVHYPLAGLCRAIERDLSHPCQTNIYLTPAHAKGFKPHYDTHDVLVLQLAGSKQWRFYDTPVDLPMRGQTFEPTKYPLGEVTQSFELAAGDTLYIPSGLVHEARSSDQSSLHITLGILAYTWTDFLHEAVNKVSEREVALRHSLPVGWASPDFDRDQMVRVLERLLADVARKVDVESALERFSDQLLMSRPPLLRGQLEQLSRLDQLTLASVVGARSALHRINDEGDLVRLRCHGKEITFPAHVGEALRYGLATDRFAITDLPGDLNDEAKIVLVRRLVREGLLALLDPA
jgi:ribosomal protein L16 Arg81 hydroxylase